jgi:hypothetical protein
MRNTDENLAWAISRLLPFAKWPGFPKEEAELNIRAKAFMRLVHNKTVREILPAADPAGNPTKYRIDPNLNDADWILDLIADTQEFFPLPVQMRALYSAYLPPASETYVRPADTEEMP